MKPDRTHSFATPARWAQLTQGIYALGLIVCMACSKEEPPPPPPEPPAEQAVVEPAPFSPPENGLLTEEQIRRFLRAHEAMAQVNDLYLDSLTGSSPDSRRSLVQALDIARDKVTRKFGLNGYAEYRWILEDAPRHPANVRILEKMNVTTVTR